jgi:hypothetical protein
MYIVRAQVTHKTKCATIQDSCHENIRQVMLLSWSSKASTHGCTYLDDKVAFFTKHTEVWYTVETHTCLAQLGRTSKSESDPSSSLWALRLENFRAPALALLAALAGFGSATLAGERFAAAGVLHDGRPLRKTTRSPLLSGCSCYLYRREGDFGNKKRRKIVQIDSTNQGIF